MNPTLYGSEVLECQQCGEVLLELSPKEAQQVAANPYNYIVYCKYCKISVEKEFRNES